ncbi:MAG: hypothetical protein ABJE10_05180 [bacterium]
MRVSRVLNPNDVKYIDEKIPLSRILFWAAVWLGLLVGVVFYFKYARLLTPLLS